MTIADICKRYRNGNACKWDELPRTEAYVEQIGQVSAMDRGWSGQPS